MAEKRGSRWPSAVSRGGGSAPGAPPSFRPRGIPAPGTGTCCQCRGHRVRVGITVERTLGEAAADDGFEVGRNVGAAVAQRRQGRFDVGPEGVGRGGTGEGRSPRDHEMEEGAEGVEIGPAVDRLVTASVANLAKLPVTETVQ